MWEFENISVKDVGIIKIENITLSIPLANATRTIKHKSSNRELIHIAINSNTLLDYNLGNPELVYERIFQILIKSENLPKEDICIFDDWCLRSLTFDNWEGKPCSAEERQAFFTYREDRVLERIYGHKGTALRDYLALINNTNTVDFYFTANKKRQN
jgi:hypothetical protein